MKFTPARSSVISSNETKKFTMAINAKSFSILTSGIYQNKIKAVIREYSTNALDSHIEANNPEPFEVHLPTENESYFYIRDYGTGLDEEQFENVFFKFFESTKDNSDIFNGTMGLGAKSLFSYNTKSFVVESWKNGYHYIYSCFIGRSGVPENSLLLKEYSQDPEGVKVQAAVNKDDIEEFEINAKYVYSFFERHPKFIGKQIELDNIYLNKFKNYSLNPRRGAYAVMGNVAYPIIHDFRLDKYRDIINSNILVFFDIGEVTFTPSRESLEYTDYTIKNLKEKFDLVYQEIDEEIKLKINNASNEWQAIKLYNSLYSSYGKNIKGLTKPKQLIWNNKVLETEPIKMSEEIVIFNLFSKSKRITDTLPIGDNNYILDDLKIGSITRCSQLRTNSGKNTYLLTKEQIDGININHDDNDFIKASTLPILQKNMKKRNSLSSFSEMLNKDYVTEAWNPVDVSQAKSKYYVVRNGYRPIYNGKKLHPIEIYKYALNSNIKDIIYGVSEKQEKNIIKLGFVNIYNVINEKQKLAIKELDDNKDTIIKLKTDQYFIDMNSSFLKNLQGINKKYDISNSPLSKLISFKEDFEKNKKTYLNWVDKINLLHTIGETYKINIEHSLIKEYQDIVEKYPLLNIENYYYSNKISVQDLYHYILGVDYASGIV